MALRLPSLDDLQLVTDLVTGGGTNYRTLPPDLRLRVIETAIQADINDSLSMLTDLNGTLENLPVAVAELEPFMTLASKFAEMEKHLHNIASDIDVLSDWFNRSTPLDIYALKGS